MAQGTARKREAVASGNQAEAAFGSFWETAARLRRLAEVRFGAFGLSPAQWRVLRLLWQRENAGDRTVRATDLCAVLLLTKATVSVLLDRLVKLGLVLRSAVASDQRVRAVSLTGRGRSVVLSILADHGEWAGRLMGGLSPAEQRRLSGLLGKLGAWLDPMVDEVAADGRSAGELRKAPANGGRPVPRRKT